MPRKDDEHGITGGFEALFADPTWSAKFPPVLTVAQAAELAQVPKGTIYTWSSQGLLRGCAQRVGKHLRIVRDAFVRKLFSDGGLHGSQR